MAHTETKESVIYFNVLADGKFHQTVPEGTEGATLRTYETSDGKEGSKWEKVYSDVSGMITKIEFADGTYGKLLLITIEDEGYDPVVVSLNCNSNFGEDVLHKLLNIDRSKSVKFAPFSFTDDKGKNRKGVSITQGDDKINSYFKKYSGETKEITYIDGFPKLPKAKAGKTVSSDEWKLWFAQSRIHMIDVIEKELGLSEEAPANTGVGSAGDDF